MSANIWNLSVRRAESLSKAGADRRNQLMLESPSRSDGDLLRLLSGGDEKAFVEFYRRHQGMVFRFALQMSGKTEIAEEVTQEVDEAVATVQREPAPDPYTENWCALSSKHLTEVFENVVPVSQP